MGVLHNDRVTPGKGVGDAVLALVAECLPTGGGEKEKSSHKTRAGGHFQGVPVHCGQGCNG